MSRLYSDEHVSLDKEIKCHKNIPRTSLDNIEDVYEIERCTSWIKRNNFKKVCLQFPDHLLPDSVPVSLKLQEMLNQTVYIMGDTAYESCCLDFIAAEHIDADCIIHFGSICFSQNIQKIPYLNIYEKQEIEVENFTSKVKIFKNEHGGLSHILIDTPFLHEINQISKGLDESTTILPLDNEIDYSEEGYYIYVGNNHRKLENILFSLNEQQLYQYDPANANAEIMHFKENPIILKRRFYLGEKIKDSQTFGIVMGTLSVDNYLKVLSRMKQLLKMNGKKYYVISVGKISVEKLANFPEMDIFIVITCAMNEVYDNREFYKPVVTPFDVEKAFNSKSDGLKFTYDYNKVLGRVVDVGELQPICVPDVSLLTGNLRSNQCKEEVNVGNQNDIALKSDGSLVHSSKFGAGYLANRTWKGLEQDLGKTEVELAREGRSGIAQCYSNEIQNQSKK